MSITYPDHIVVDRPVAASAIAATPSPDNAPYTPVYARSGKARNGRKAVKTWMILVPIGAVVMIGGGVAMAIGGRSSTLSGRRTRRAHHHGCAGPDTAGPAAGNGDRSADQLSDRLNRLKASPVCPAGPLSFRASGAGRGYAPDYIADVIGHQRQADGLAIDKGDRDDLVAAARFPVPRSVLADDGGVPPGRDQ